VENQIFYKDGYKYQLKQNYSHQTPFVGVYASTDFILLVPTGLLVIKRGYAWDGPSGPTIDTKDFMRGSLVHDALYQLMREGHLDTVHKDTADRILQEICIQDGMNRFIAVVVYQAVKKFGGPATDPNINHPLLTAP
jgi:hypothetical protein